MKTRTTKAGDTFLVDHIDQSTPRDLNRRRKLYEPKPEIIAHAMTLTAICAALIIILAILTFLSI